MSENSAGVALCAARFVALSLLLVVTMYSAVSPLGTSHILGVLLGVDWMRFPLVCFAGHVRPHVPLQNRDDYM